MSPMRILLPCILLLCAACANEAAAEGGREPAPVGASAADSEQAAGLYALSAETLEGDPAALADYAGRVTLVVNVASQCGYTKQYAGLQALHEEFGPRGFEVLGFPSNEFGNQEPGNPVEIREFCTENFQVTFPMFAKCHTQAGDARSPVYAYLTESAGESPSWNFCKYLVGRDGRVLGYFPSKVGPEDEALRSAIEGAL